MRSIELDARHPTRSFSKLLLTYRLRLLASGLVFVAKDSPLWLMPVITAAIIDVVVGGGDGAQVLVLAGVAGVVIAQNVPSQYLFSRWFGGLTRRLGADLRNALVAQLQTLSIGFHARFSAAVLQSKVVRDVENIELMMQQAGPSALSSALVLTGAITMTAIAVPQFVPVFALTVPLAAGLWTITSRRSSKRNAKFRREVEHFSSHIGEMAALLPLTRAHGLEKVASEKVNRSAETLRSAGLSLDVTNGTFGALAWVCLQLLGITCLAIASLAALGHWIPISPGEVVLMSSYFALLTGALTSLISILPILTRGLESVRSVAEALQEPDREINEGKRRVSSVAGRIELRDVHFRYQDSQNDAIDGVSLAITAGETVAFVGPSGSGKSTLVNLVLGFYRAQSGEVLIDGQDIERLDMRSVRAHISAVPQESVLFSGTIRDNVAYGNPTATDELIYDALRQAHAAEVVRGLPEGLDTVVGAGGTQLSGGQRQRISLARALVRHPRILLLDEPTSALDADSEQRVRLALASRTAGCTTLIVAHRLSTVRASDRIVYLERGKIIEVGNHDQLMNNHGPYARLYSQQF